MFKKILFLSYVFFNIISLHGSNVRLIAITPDAEKIIAYIARVSNPKNQENQNFEGLLKYCIKHHHWSVFEQAFMTLEIVTTRATSTQILRHRSFTFQQFSQRYADNFVLMDDFEFPELRTQDTKNRQNSLDTLTDEEKTLWQEKIKALLEHSMQPYQDMLAAGIAKECARFILPECMPTKLYMSGSIRSWIHYIDLRSGNGTQLEHARIAKMCKQIFVEQLPTIANALGWK